MNFRLGCFILIKTDIAKQFMLFKIFSTVKERILEAKDKHFQKEELHTKVFILTPIV